MAGEERFTQGTVNEALSRGEDRASMQLCAAGFSVIGKPKPTPAQLRDPQRYNGGMQNQRIGRLQTTDLLFRFSDSRCTTMAEKFGGAWWFDRECMATIRSASRMENCSFAAAARSYLGILHEWGDMKNLVGGLLTADFWCFRGLTAGVDSARLKLSGPLRTDVMQIFVPGDLSLGYFTQARDDILTSLLV